MVGWSMKFRTLTVGSHLISAIIPSGVEESDFMDLSVPRMEDEGFCAGIYHPSVRHRAYRGCRVPESS